MQKINQTYYAHGKLLLTAEYFVLCGAKAVALPLRYGQRMDVAEGKQEQVLSWKAFMQEGLWFSCDFRLPDLSIIHSSDREKALILQETFLLIRQLNPGFRFDRSLEIHNRIDFNNQWGLGSSSTLMANLAEWAGVDPFQLNEMIFNGSGFDIACAKAGGPIFYQKGHCPEAVDLDYSFKDHLYFIYSGAKKSTRNEVRRFLTDHSVRDGDIERMNQFSDAIVASGSLPDFMRLLHEHEQMVSSLVGLETVQAKYFSDFNGQVKSLGAWGGDFYLVATAMDDREVLRYFKEKGLTVVFPWEEMVLNESVTEKI